MQTISYYADEKGINVEFFLNGESHGDNVEPLFKDFNRAFDLLIGE